MNNTDSNVTVSIVKAKLAEDNIFVLKNYRTSSAEFQRDCSKFLAQNGINSDKLHIAGDNLEIPKFKHYLPNLSSIVAAFLKERGFSQDSKTKINKRQKKHIIKSFNDHVCFEEVFLQAKTFANFLRTNQERIAGILQQYECYNVAIDEIERSIELLENLDKNQEYFCRKINKSIAFLPLNQPLYASVCFGLVISLMSRNTYIRPPTVMHEFFQRLSETVNFQKYFPNVMIAYDTKESFVENHKSDTDVVIFTGLPQNANKVRNLFAKNTLFIINGAGHNPIIVAEEANLSKAVESTLRVCFQNQGQDCAAPNSILVHKNKVEEFLRLLKESCQDVQKQIGSYSDKKNIIGPNSDPDHTKKIVNYLSANRMYCIYPGNIDPVSGMIEPYIISKPLSHGGNFEEMFAPVIVVQPYDKDQDLSMYFESDKYKKNAMYVTVFGNSEYVKTLVDKNLHTEENILYDTDLHAEEKGYLEYGGLGVDASCLWFNGTRHKGATLPQRDIYKHLVVPNLMQAETQNSGEVRQNTHFTEVTSIEGVAITQEVQL